MKKVFFLSLVVGGLGFVSCKKCQTCTVETYQEYQGAPAQTTSTTNEYCGDDYDNAPAEGTINQDLGSAQQTVTTTCTDN